MRKQDIKVGQQVGWKIYKRSTPRIVKVLNVGTFENSRWNGQSAKTAVDIEFQIGDETKVRRVPGTELVSMEQVAEEQARNEELRQLRVERQQVQAARNDRAAKVVAQLAAVGVAASATPAANIVLTLESAEMLAAEMLAEVLADHTEVE